MSVGHRLLSGTDRQIRWGILGGGRMATVFAQALSELPDADLMAVASRRQRRARVFAKRFGVRRCYSSYQELVEDDDVDVVYVATPNTMHKGNVLLALERGKAVLCEKPFSVNAGETEAMIAAARNAQLFLMEAMYMRFVPSIVRLRELIREGVIGDVRMLIADLGYRVPFRAWDRLFDPALGGGVLLDLGVYPLSLASMLFGSPTRIQSSAEIGLTGVDEHASMVLDYAEGQTALLSCSFRLETPQEATIVGTGGRIRVESPWTRATTLTVTPSTTPMEIPEFKPFDELMRRTREGVARLPIGTWLRRNLEPSNVRRYRLPISAYGHKYEALEVMRCLREGRRESEGMPLDETRQIMETMDRLREMWGVRLSTESSVGP